MRRGRPLTAVVALWLAGFAAEPAMPHACPVHDGSARGGVTAPAPGLHAHGAQAHHEHRARPVDRNQDAGHHAPRHGCTCPGACCVSVPIAAPAAEAIVVVAVVVAPPRRWSTPAPIPRRTTPEHARPPSLGPPALPVG